MKNILITGGTGSIGSHLVPMLLAKGFQITILTRNTSLNSSLPQLKYSPWNPDNLAYDKKPFEECDYIIHLAGANIAEKKWTEKRKVILCQSRIRSSETIIKALAETNNHTYAIISASGINYYANKGNNQLLTEEDFPGEGFLSKLCADWENKISEAKAFSKRVVIFRTGVVLDKKSGAYPKLIAPLKFRIAAVIGGGKQAVSWIHIHDLCRAYIHAIENDSMEGSFNACAPEITTNEKLMVSAAHKKFGNAFLKFHVPSFLLKMALGELAEEAILADISASSQKLRNTGFRFEYVSLEKAIENLEEK